MNTVYVFDGHFSFVKKDEHFAKSRLRNKDDNLFYVLDKHKGVICFCDLGGHLPSIIFLLRNYYGLVNYTEEDISKWQKIISENFVLYNSAVDSAEHYADEIMTGSSVEWSDDLEEKNV